VLINLVMSRPEQTPPRCFFAADLHEANLEKDAHTVLVIEGQSGTVQWFDQQYIHDQVKNNQHLPYVATKDKYGTAVDRQPKGSPYENRKAVEALKKECVLRGSNLVLQGNVLRAVLPMAIWKDTLDKHCLDVCHTLQLNWDDLHAYMQTQKWSGGELPRVVLPGVEKIEWPSDEKKGRAKAAPSLKKAKRRIFRFLMRMKRSAKMMGTTTTRRKRMMMTMPMMVLSSTV
jgi:hypothetical protein